MPSPFFIKLPETVICAAFSASFGQILTELPLYELSESVFSDISLSAAGVFQSDQLFKSSAPEL